MYHVYVPISMSLGFDAIDRGAMVRQLRKLHADTVLLSIGACTDAENLCSEIGRYKKFLEGEGFQTAIWMGGSLLHFDYDKPYRQTVLASGKKSKLVCPLDENFISFYAGYVKKFASCGVKLILLDDDFRMHWTEEAACFCPRHMREYSERLGKTVTRREMASQILNGEPNEYRKVWMQVMAETLRNFARAIRAAVDEVNPSVTVGLCAGGSNLGNDGVSAEELAKILAGANRPFLRLHGAPYWAVSNRARPVPYCVEEERMLASFCGKESFLVSEGDTYPRPRLRCPAVYLEGFDAALHTEDRMNGIIKYGCDYFADYDYEEGYANAADANFAFCSSVREMFCGKDPCGFNIAEDLFRLARAEFAKDASRAGVVAESDFPGPLFCVQNSMPCCYNRFDLPTVVFGCNVLAYREKLRFENGVVLDAEAAKILYRWGIDVGLRAEPVPFKPAPLTVCSCTKREYFVRCGKEVGVNFDDVYEFCVHPRAEILTRIKSDGREYTGAYYYENAFGGKFYVLPYGMRGCRFDVQAFVSYYRQSELAYVYERMRGEPLEAVCTGNPGLYSIVKKRGAQVSVFLWNYCADAVERPVIRMAQEVSSVNALRCAVSAEGKNIRLSRLEPFGFCAFEATLSR